MSRTQLHAPLRVRVVEQQLVVARATEFLGAHAPLGRRIAMAVVGARGAVPYGAVAGGEVALRRRSVVAGRLEDGRRVVAVCRLPAGRGGVAALALAVVQRADDDGTVDVVLDELHQHFLADARQELAAHAAAGRSLRHPHPARGVAAVLPVVADADAAQRVAVQFIGTAGLVAAVGADDDGALRAMGRRFRVAAGVAARQFRAPRDLRRQRVEAVGVPEFAGLVDDEGHVLVGHIGCNEYVFQQFRNGAEQFGQGLHRRRRQVVYADAGHAQDRVAGRRIAEHGQWPLRDVDAGAGGQGAHRRTAMPGLAACLARFHLDFGVVLRQGAAGEGVLARHVVALQHRQPGELLARWHAGGHRLLGLVVVAEEGRQGRDDAAAFLQGLDAVLLFRRAGAVEADAAILFADPIERHRALLAAVGEQHQAVAFFQLLDTPAQAFFRQQAAYKIAVLRNWQSRRWTHL